jgi:hypothetical protein
MRMIGSIFLAADREKKRIWCSLVCGYGVTDPRDLPPSALQEQPLPTIEV